MPFRVGASIPLLLSSSRTGAKSEWRSAIVSREESIVAGAVARAQKARSGGVSTAGGGRRCNGLLRGVGRNVFHHARPALLVSQDGQPRERAAEIAARQSQSCSPRDLIRRPRIQADRGRRENSAPYKRRQKDRLLRCLRGLPSKTVNQYKTIDRFCAETRRLKSTAGKLFKLLLTLAQKSMEAQPASAGFRPAFKCLAGVALDNEYVANVVALSRLPLHAPKQH